MTRKLTFATLALAVVLSLTAFAQTGSAASPAPAAPAGPAPIKIGFISFEQAVFSTNEGQREADAVMKKFDPKQQELKSQTDEVENLKKQLQTQGDKLNDEARATLVKNIETKSKSLQRSMEDAQGEFQREQGEVFNKVGAKVFKTMEKYAKDNGFAAIINVIPSDQQNPPGQLSLLWFVPQVNVTKEIVDAYNKESGVAPLPTAKPAAAAPRPSAPVNRPATPATTPKK
jgi:outer membrane protein